ncbi:MAG: hypothetical protein QOJ91_389 [Sphingomonadales bacterium]|jgi:hypothetical protein|nr:hypothetical protein [Sphingomonadales bacterium]
MMKKPLSRRLIDLRRILAGLALLAAPVLAGCAEQAQRIAVCPLPGGASAEPVPAGFATIAWAPVGTVHYPPDWEAKVGPYSESVLNLRSPDGTVAVSLEAGCCSGSDLLRSKTAEIAHWSGRTFWIERSGQDRHYFAFPFAQVAPQALRDHPGSALRPPIGLSARAVCGSADGCATAQKIVRSIGYDEEATRRARQGDELVARIGAAARPPAAAPRKPASAGGPPPPPAPPEPQPLFTPELCRS